MLEYHEMCLWQITSWWDVITSISSAVLALGIIVVFWQINLLKKQTSLSAFSSLLQQWGGKEERLARRYVMREFKFDEGDNLEDLYKDSLDNLDNVELVLATCDRTSFLALKVPQAEKDIVEFVGLPMFRIWGKTKNFIEARKKREGTYLYHFEQFKNKNRRKLEKMSLLEEKQVTKQKPVKEV